MKHIAQRRIPLHILPPFPSDSLPPLLSDLRAKAPSARAGRPADPSACSPSVPEVLNSPLHRQVRSIGRCLSRYWAPRLENLPGRLRLADVPISSTSPPPVVRAPDARIPVALTTFLPLLSSSSRPIDGSISSPTSTRSAALPVSGAPRASSPVSSLKSPNLLEL